ncbi:hypothetical protein NT239_05755 [Chitinibacter sp. SCUT-21]|uniref:hypothetical protein n=1 Tax=Chitinibacter sp. SCUT-21 TaxID=2970891 RepID=UPI0035A66512
MSQTVLIVDTQRESRLYTRQIISQLKPGWHFLEAASDTEAIDHCIRESIDLVSIHQQEHRHLAHKLHVLLPHSLIIEWCDTPADVGHDQFNGLYYAAAPVNAATFTELLNQASSKRALFTP